MPAHRGTGVTGRPGGRRHLPRDNFGNKIGRDDPPIDVARLVKRLTHAAGVEGDFAAHSLRAGFITSAAATKGVSEADIQRVAGHHSGAILHGYVRRANVFDEAPLTAILSL